MADKLEFENLPNPNDLNSIDDVVLVWKVKFKKIKKNLLLIGSLFALVVTALYFVAGNYGVEKMSYTKTIKKMEADLSDVKNQISILDNKSNLINRHLNAWSSIPENKKDINNIKMAKIRGDILTHGQKYGLQNVDLNMSAPEIVKSGFDNEDFNLMLSTITVKILSVTDIEVFNFIDTVNNNVSGYLIPVSLTINKTKDVDREYIKSLYNGIKPIVSTNITLLWYTLSDKKQQS